MVTLLIFSALLLGVLVYLATANKSPAGFREIVASGKERRRFFENTLPAEGLQTWSEWRIRGIVRRYVTSQGQTREFWQLIHLGERAIPALVRVLRNERNYRRPAPRPGGLFNRSPVERAIEILSRFHLPDLTPYYRKMASSPDYHLRYSAAVQLGHYPTPETLPLLAELFADSEEHVTHGVLIGFHHAIREQTMPPRVKAAVRDLLVSALRRDLGFMLSDSCPAALLLAMGDPEALPPLLSSEVLSAQNPQAALILECLAKNKVSIPRERLDALLLSLQNKPDEQLDEALIKAFASSGHPDAETRILASLAAKPDAAATDDERKRLDRRQEAAAEALCILRGIPDPVGLACSKCDGENRSLPLPLTHIVLVSEVDAEICNGGFDQYFFNCSGDQADKAVHALRAVGATGKAEILRQAMSLFGPRGPSKIREQRHLERERFSAPQAQEMAALDNAWYEDGENVRLLLHLYASSHRRAFDVG